jgi:thymidylate synthase
MNSQENAHYGRTLIARAKNLNEVLGDIYWAVMNDGRRKAPRGKEVLEWRAPVVIDLKPHDHPWTFLPGRRLNPYFAVAEVIWILAGRGDVDFIAYYNKNIATFSDDGKTFHGAYGDRIRNFPIYVHAIENEQFTKDFIDQFTLVIDRLHADNDSRQGVVCLWDPPRDLKSGSKDYPCNNLCYFSLRDGFLDMSVIRRSNDMVWGLPYNQIQFYFVQALVAGSLGVKMGGYYEFVQNMHVYTEQYPELYQLINSRLIEMEAEDKGLTESIIEGSLEEDRTISLKQFDAFARLFFKAEHFWRQDPESLKLEDIQLVGLKMLEAGIPKYWVDNMLVVPAAYIAWRAFKLKPDTTHLYDLWERLVSELEPGLKWLVKDFHTKAENRVER